MARILALFAVAPSADPKSLLGAIDVPCKMSGSLKFSILKIRFSNLFFFFQISNFLIKTTFFQGHNKFDPKLSPDLRSPGSHRRHGGLARLLNLVAETTTYPDTRYYYYYYSCSI
jgi:hypothetical protein